MARENAEKTHISSHKIPAAAWGQGGGRVSLGQSTQGAVLQRTRTGGRAGGFGWRCPQFAVCNVLD